jgi:hypothetical protein
LLRSGLASFSKFRKLAPQQQLTPGGSLLFRFATSGGTANIAKR